MNVSSAHAPGVAYQPPQSAPTSRAVNANQKVQQQQAVASITGDKDGDNDGGRNEAGPSAAQSGAGTRLNIVA